MPQLKFKTERGVATPLGATLVEGGINFAIFSKKKPLLCLFEHGHFVCDFSMKHTGDVWHLMVHDVPDDFTYAYEVDGEMIIDPYSRTSNGAVRPSLPFDWKGDEHPNLPVEELIIYEMHVKGFGKTFKGVEKKLSYLQDLGVNAIELMPVFSFDTSVPFQGPEPLSNYWGYNTVNFFSLHRPYGTIEEFKSLVRAAHKKKMEVILDVVYNHSASWAFRALAPEIYFMRDQKGHDLNFSGCGNTINCNHPVMAQLILASLRYFVTEMHVDGYRFDLAPIMMRGQRGRPLLHPPLIEAISNDPVLANTKLIAEPWDPGGLYKLGGFPRGRWLEWNGKYRDTVRQFIKGTDGVISDFATRLCGSLDLFETPSCSVNFVTCHDGFTLHDLVSYNEKHNELNGEENQDGDNHNNSWNCGIEGVTQDCDVLKLRERQMKNFFFALMVSKGVPMINMGDEYGHTKNGNNNTWSHDSAINWFNWKAKSPLTEFVKKLIVIRKEHLMQGDIFWHGTKPSDADWNPNSRFIAFQLGEVYIAINAGFKGLDVQLPEGKWKVLIDTNWDHEAVVEGHYYLEAHTSIMLQRVTN